MRKQTQKLGMGSRLMFAAVSLMFIFGGAFIIYNDNRLARENERLATSGIDAIAIVTGKAREICGGHESPEKCYAIEYEFPVESGSTFAGTTYPYLESVILFDVPGDGPKILHDKLEVGDQILVKYITDDPSVHRIQKECRSCGDPGAFKYIPIFAGVFLILIGSLVLYAIRKHLFARL